MKRIRERNKPTPGLAKYLAAVGNNANWEGFRDHNASASYNELIEKLIDVQHGLCGYCEINLTDEILNLNAERLRSAREKQWNDLEEEADQIGDPDDSDIMDAWMRSVLMPDDAGRLVSFFTTARSYFGPLAERVLKQQPQAWIYVDIRDARHSPD